jgi:hypothetical protein
LYIYVSGENVMSKNLKKHWYLYGSFTRIDKRKNVKVEGVRVRGEGVSLN